MDNEIVVFKPNVSETALAELKDNESHASRAKEREGNSGRINGDEIGSDPLEVNKPRFTGIRVKRLETMKVKRSSVNETGISNETATKSTGKSRPKDKWSKMAKRTLLDALKKHGPKNMDAISKMLPKISPELIEARIFIYEVLADYFYKDELINNWIQCGICKPDDSCVPEALLFIKLLENHPAPSESKFDYREIYNYLHRAFSFKKQSLLDLKAQDRNMLLSLISKIDAKVYPKRQNQLWKYLGKVYPRRNIKHVYPGKKSRLNAS